MTIFPFSRPCPRCGDQFPTLMQLQQHHVWAHERPHPDPAVQAYLRAHPVGLPPADAIEVLPYPRPMSAQGPTAVNGLQEGQ